MKWKDVKTKFLVSALVVMVAISGCGKKAPEAEDVASSEAESGAVSISEEEEVLVVSESEAVTPTPEAEEEKEEQKEKEKEPEKEPVDKDALRSQLIIMKDQGMYTYDQMLADTEILKELYPDLMTQDSIGTTADGRQLIHYVVGNPNAEKQIFINAAIHAREFLTFQLVMKQMCVYLEHVDAGDQYGNMTYKDMWDSVQIHVVPLINPDGVQISQFGVEGIQNESVRQTVYNITSMDGSAGSSYYYDRWKANAEGVDLNRNFDAYWEYYGGTGQPSADHYKGTAPGSAPEAAALINLTMENNFLYTISYHTQGRVIYWCFENMDPIYDISASWVSKIAAQTGYSPINDYSTVDPAGYSDWAIYRLQIPSVVIEVAYGESPYHADQFQQVWEENLNIWEMTVIEAMNR